MNVIIVIYTYYLNIVCLTVPSYFYGNHARDVFATAILNGRRYDVVYQIIVLFTEFSWGGYNILLDKFGIIGKLKK
jgi:hypothetical protein